MTGESDRQSLSSAKKELRQEMFRQRDALESATRVFASSRITDQILALDSFVRAHRVLAHAGLCQHGQRI